MAVDSGIFAFLLFYPLTLSLIFQGVQKFAPFDA